MLILCFILIPIVLMLMFFFFNDTATTEIYTLSLHDALPICGPGRRSQSCEAGPRWHCSVANRSPRRSARSEEHTSELQSRSDLVCRLLLEKKKKKEQRKMAPHKLRLTTHSNIHAQQQLMLLS